MAATNGNGVANATMIALYAEMERRHLGVFASNTTVDLGQWLGAMATVSSSPQRLHSLALSNTPSRDPSPDTRVSRINR